MRPPGHGPTLGGMSEPSVTVTEIPDGAAIIDVREDDEWEAGHIEGAIHVPLGELPERLDDLPLDDDMYIICRTGGRSRGRRRGSTSTASTPTTSKAVWARGTSTTASPSSRRPARNPG